VDEKKKGKVAHGNRNISSGIRAAEKIRSLLQYLNLDTKASTTRPQQWEIKIRKATARGTRDRDNGRRRKRSSFTGARLNKLLTVPSEDRLGTGRGGGNTNGKKGPRSQEGERVWLEER